MERGNRMSTPMKDTFRRLGRHLLGPAPGDPLVPRWLWLLRALGRLLRP